MQLVIPKAPVTKKQLERLQKLSGRPKGEPNNKDQKPDVSKLITADQPVLSPEMLKESPVAHRLTDLLGGHDNDTELYSSSSQTVTDVNCLDNKSNDTVQCKNPDAVRARLFDPKEPTSFPLMQGEGCVTDSCCPDVVKRTYLEVEENQNDSSLANYSPKADIGAASGMKNETSGNEVAKHCDQVHLSIENDVSDAQTFDVSNCSNVREYQSSIGSFLQETVNSDITVKSGVTQDAMSSSEGENSIDYESGYNTLEVCQTFAVFFC